MSGVRKNYLALFWILTIVVYFIGLIIINRGLGFRNIGIFGVALIAYYVGNIYNIAVGRYRLRDMAVVCVVNFIFATVANFFKIFTIDFSVLLSTP